MAKKQALVIGENIIVPEKTQIKRVIHDWGNNLYTIELSVINDKGAHNYTIEDVSFSKISEAPSRADIEAYVENHIAENTQEVELGEDGFFKRILNFLFE
jgi:hypothetical protein